MAQELVGAALQFVGESVVVVLVQEAGNGFRADKLTEFFELSVGREAAGEAMRLEFAVVEGRHNVREGA